MCHVAIVQAVERRVRRGDRAVVLVALHHAVRDPWRERAIGRNLASVHGKPDPTEIGLERGLFGTEAVPRVEVLAVRRPKLPGHRDRRVARIERTVLHRLAGASRRGEHGIRQQIVGGLLRRPTAERSPDDLVIQAEEPLVVLEPRREEQALHGRIRVVDPRQLLGQQCDRVRRLPLLHGLEPPEAEPGPPLEGR